MLFSYTLLFFALINSTSVLAAPVAMNKPTHPYAIHGGLVLPARDPDVPWPPLPPPGDPGKQLIGVGLSLLGDWYRMPMPKNLRRPPLGAIHRILYSKDMLSFGMLGARFVYYYGAGAHVDYDPKLVGLGGTQPYVTIKPADAQERENEVYENLRGTIPPDALLIGYWRSAEPNSEKYMRITLDEHNYLVTRPLRKDEVDWAKEELAFLGKGQKVEEKGVLLGEW